MKFRYIANFYKIRKRDHDFLLGNKLTEGSLPFIVPVVAGVVEGNAGFVYTSVTGAGVVTPEQINKSTWLPPAKSYYFVSVLFKNIPGEQETAVDGSYINDLDVCEKKTQFVGK
jgi:hypothetical protein